MKEAAVPVKLSESRALHMEGFFVGVWRFLPLNT